MISEGIEFLEILIEVHKGQLAHEDKYPKMRSLLERVCKDLTSKENIQFSNLFSRLNYVCDNTKLDKRKTYQINSFRINANKVLHNDYSPSVDEYLQDLKALSNAISHFYSVPIPDELKAELPKVDYFKPKERQGRKHDRIRVEVTATDSEYIYAYDEDNSTEEPIKIKHHIAGINEEFNQTVAELWKGCQLNLLDVTIDELGVYLPDLIVLEPDYLIDISSLSECFKEYSKHPLNYVQNKFEALANTKHILLGNAANLFLDEFVNEKPTNPVTYAEAMKKSFKSAPFEFSTCAELDTNFFQNAQNQFLNIKNVVNNVFPAKEIDRENGIIEPSFICEQLGLQGRLDFLQVKTNSGKQFVIELKSGRAPNPEENFGLVGINHETQAFLYQIVIQKVLGVKFSNEFQTFILYSKYSDPSANLRLSKAYMAAIKEIINIRNLIVANEKRIASDKTNSQTRTIINNIEPTTLINRRINNQYFIDTYIIPQINYFKSFFHFSSELELEYFHSFYNFISKEHFISKLGDTEHDSGRGISSLWLSSLEEKIDAGEILTNLTIIENLTEKENPTLTFAIPENKHAFLHNFRQGDIIILHECNNPEDNVTNKQIFKGSIETISPKEIKVRIRYKQRNQDVLPLASKYVIQHDFLDSSYNSMYRGLYAFLQANQNRKDLLLNQRQPTQDPSNYMENIYDSVEIQQIVYKAKIANDYFLLVGPPGTGKTSIALKSMVEEFYCEPANNILLLSYTNRAVDEICDTLNKLRGNPKFIRIGSELSCDHVHRSKLLEEVIKNCDNREQVRAKIEEHRIFVGTVSSISSKTELFKLKSFQVAIIDEASQILEPSLLGILSAKNSYGGNAIAKFILIGDHKQLPAVVLQKEIDSKVSIPVLNKIGLYDKRNSLFERLYNLHKSDKNSLVWSMLYKQGRMHPAIALFPNYSFYNSQLQIVPTNHQLSALEYTKFDDKNAIQKLIFTKRIAFMPSEKHKSDKSNKTNTHEARMVRELLKNIFELYTTNSLNFKAEETVGIITPFRNQIALIKKEIFSLEIPELNNVTVDTVERFQGSQRDIIIYSFSINEFYQLDFLAGSSIMDEGQIIDRKLNVAITRAKKQLFVVGNPIILSNNLTYYRLIEFIRSKSGYIKTTPDDFISRNFDIQEHEAETAIGIHTHEPSQAFVNNFERIVIQTIRENPKTNFPNQICGFDHDYNRMNVIQYGRANFDQGTLDHSPLEKVYLYCYYNMRKHYFSSLAIFKSFSEYFKKAFDDCNNRIMFIDFGCGPLTAGLAFNQEFSNETNFHLSYAGIDISSAMLTVAESFSKTNLFSDDARFLFVRNLNEIPDDYWDSLFVLSNTVILNFSYIFGNLSKDDVERLAVQINRMLDKFPLNKYIAIYQNSAIEKRNRTYCIFKKLVPRLVSITQPKIETVGYRNSIASNYDKSEDVFFELLEV